MCGRYVLSVDADTLQREFNLDTQPVIEARYNIAPSQPVPAITNDAPRSISLLLWGLVPHWAKDPKIGYKMINARSETAAEKPSFRTAFKHRRCLIPATGFYEWKAAEGGKVPHFIHLPESPVFSFAGLWSVWHSPEGDELYTCTILTTDANEKIAPLHQRMPVILERDDRDIWLAKDTDPTVLQALMKPYNGDKMDYYPVSKAVNRPANEGPNLIERDDPPQQQSLL